MRRRLGQAAADGIEPAGRGRDGIAEARTVGDRQVLAVLIEHLGIGGLGGEEELPDVGQLLAPVDHAHRDVVEFVGGDGAQRLRHHEGLAIEERRGHVVGAVHRVAAHRPGCVAGDQVYRPGLQLGEAAIAGKRNELHLARVAEDGHRHRAAEIYVEARPAALRTRLREAGERVAGGADQMPAFANRGERRSSLGDRLLRCGEAGEQARRRGKPQARREREYPPCCRTYRGQRPLPCRRRTIGTGA